VIVAAVARSGERGMCRQVDVGIGAATIKERTFHRIAALQIVEDIVGFRGFHSGNTGSSLVGSAEDLHGASGFRMRVCVTRSGGPNAD
jgi:hypothetical protein